MIVARHWFMVAISRHQASGGFRKQASAVGIREEAPARLSLRTDGPSRKALGAPEVAGLSSAYLVPSRVWARWTRCPSCYVGVERLPQKATGVRKDSVNGDQPRGQGFPWEAGKGADSIRLDSRKNFSPEAMIIRTCALY